VLRRQSTMLVPLLLLAACGSAPAPRTTALDDDAITVASFNFSESVLLAQLYGQALRSTGFRVELALDLGARELVEAARHRGRVGRCVV
jgi:osmoprotectant transport system substrate-binding protein